MTIKDWTKARISSTKRIDKEKYEALGRMKE